jgi:hypothetical protein
MYLSCAAGATLSIQSAVAGQHTPMRDVPRMLGSRAHRESIGSVTRNAVENDSHEGDILDDGSPGREGIWLPVLSCGNSCGRDCTHAISYG